MSEMLGMAMEYWLGVTTRCLWGGSISLVVAWAIDRCWVSMPPEWKNWLWRLAFVKLVVFCFAPVVCELAILTPRTAMVPVRDLTLIPSSEQKGSIRSLVPGKTATSQPMRVASRSLPTSSTNVFYGCLCGTWCIISCSLGIRWRWERRRLWEMANRASVTWDPRLRAELASMASRFGLTRSPEILISGEFQSPCLMERRRPILVIPCDWPGLLDVTSLRIMLAHELAHSIRRDLLWNRLVSCASSCFFFHPLVWIASHRYAASPEIACDAVALAKTRAPASQLSRLLIHCLDAKSRPSLPGAAAFDGVPSNFDSSSSDSPSTSTRIRNRARSRSRSYARSQSRSGSQAHSKTSVSIHRIPDEATSRIDASTENLSPSSDREPSNGSTRHRTASRSKPASWQRSAQSEDDRRRISVEEQADRLRVTILDRASGEEQAYEAKDITELELQSKDAADAYRELMGGVDDSAAAVGADAQQMLREQLRRLR